MNNGRAQGYLSITLHAHLPYVVHHGIWPHGLEWLLEATAETYLPLLRVLKNLERDGVPVRLNINLSPILLEQFSHPTFRAEFPEYVKRKIQAAREDEEYFRQSGDAHFVRTARMWREFFEQSVADFEGLGGDLVSGFRGFADAGMIEVITSCATHSYLPLLGTDESVVAQVKMGAATHERHLGRKPKGMWIPECGYRPAGVWQPPVIPQGSGNPWPAFQRVGVEEALAEAGIGFFSVDSHLVEESILFTPYELKSAGGPVGAAAVTARYWPACESLYRTWCVDGPLAAQHPVVFFPRDPRTGLQVWSGDTGYPGEALYLDFHKKRWPGGHRYWQVTQSNSGMVEKTPYHPDRAAARTREHAGHFVGVVCDTLRSSLSEDRPPVLSAPFDAELFGHWWFEGPQWLEHVLRIMASENYPIATTTCSEYLAHTKPEGFFELKEGSWGKDGGNEVWLNPETAWTWSHIYPAEAKVREIATEGRWRNSATGQRLARQMCRELMLLESSDWQFLITTAAARDYAEGRVQTHVEQFRTLENAWDEFTQTAMLGACAEREIAAIEARDNIFPDVDPDLWIRRS
jgi:1,4-alpha-glucan branching enzyme